jgi:hypothetical protein
MHSRPISSTDEPGQLNRATVAIQIKLWIESVLQASDATEMINGA